MRAAGKSLGVGVELADAVISDLRNGHRGGKRGAIGRAGHPFDGQAARPVAGFDAGAQVSEGVLDLSGIVGEEPLVDGDDRGRWVRGGRGARPVGDLVELDVGLPDQHVRGPDGLRACLRAEHEDARPPLGVLPLAGEVVAGEQDRGQLDGRRDSALGPRGGRGRPFGVGIACPAGRQHQDRGADHNHQGTNMQTHGTPPPSVRCHRVCTGAQPPLCPRCPPSATHPGTLGRLRAVGLVAHGPAGLTWRCD